MPDGAPRRLQYARRPIDYLNFARSRATRQRNIDDARLILPTVSMARDSLPHVARHLLDTPSPRETISAPPFNEIDMGISRERRAHAIIL